MIIGVLVFLLLLLLLAILLLFHGTFVGVGVMGFVLFGIEIVYDKQTNLWLLMMCCYNECYLPTFNYGISQSKKGGNHFTKFVHFFIFNY